MVRWKRNLRIETEFEFYPHSEGGAKPKHRLLCCSSAADASPHIPTWFNDKHYPEDNGFYYQYFGNAVGERWHYCPWCGHEIEYERFADVEIHPEEVGKER